MQIAHPSVAAAVAEHSNYRHDRWGRLLRTVRPMYAIIFGTPEQAVASAASVNRLHEVVRGPGYRATDPELLAWVLATLIDTAIRVHERFVGPLPGLEVDRYYADAIRAGALLGVPSWALPPDFNAFTEYMAAHVASLEVSEEARTIARDLFRPLPGTGPAIELARRLTGGLLPPRLRAAYGLGWSPGEQALLVGAALSRFDEVRSRRNAAAASVPAAGTRAETSRRGAAQVTVRGTESRQSGQSSGS